MKTNVYSIVGEKIKEIDLPKIFESTVDLNLIKRVVLSIQSARVQPKGPNPRAGRNTTAVYLSLRKKPARHRIMNNEIARLPRKKNRRYLVQGDVAGVPQAVGGPRVHRPVTEKILKERINKKEKKLGTQSAIASTALKELAKQRGHKFNDELTFPIVLEDKLEELEKTKQVIETLTKLNLLQDVEKAKAKKHVRAGRGKTRGRKYKRAKSLLIVANNTDKIFKAARNLEGVDVTRVKDLNAELLAPGTQPGRLTIWTESAIQKLNK